MTDRPEYSPEQVEAAKEYIDERQEMYQRQAVNQVLNGNTADAAKWEEEATAIRTILSALAKAEGDSKRLDFLSSDCNAVLAPTFHKATKNFGSLVRVNGAEAWGFTLREAIDAAMTKESE